MGKHGRTQFHFTCGASKVWQCHRFIKILLCLFFSHTPFRTPVFNSVQVTNYSSSMVAGGLLVMSSITRHTP